MGFGGLLVGGLRWVWGFCWVLLGFLGFVGFWVERVGFACEGVSAGPLVGVWCSMVAD